MSGGVLVVLVFLGILIFVFLGFPICFTIGGLGLLFGLLTIGDGMLGLMGNAAFSLMQNYTLAAIPLFVFMGCMLDQSQIATKAFEVMSEWLRGFRGGLAAATIIICTLFAACTGIVGASVTTMGLLALAPMLKQGYDRGLATGVVAAGGTLGILIPPSIMLVIFGPIAGISVVDLFAAAFSPGFLLSALYILFIIIAPRFNKKLIPKPDKEALKSIPKKYTAFEGIITFVPFIALILMVLGTIFLGIAAPTEAAAMGAGGAIILALCLRKLTFRVLKESAIMTLRTTSMCLFVALGANIFTSMFFAIGGNKIVADAIVQLNLGPYGVLFIVLFIVFILGMLIDWIGILLIVTPIVMPILTDFGFDPLWAGMVIIVMLQSSFLTPPFATSLFYLKGVSPPEVTTLDLYKGGFTFVVLQLIGLALCIIFPDIIMWLPNMLGKGF